MFLLILFIIIPLLTAAISFYNLITAPCISTGSSVKHSSPAVSVLIPARNEELNIEMCIKSVLCQSYPDYEVLVLDDHSADSTGEILNRLERNNKKLKVIQGLPLPTAWLGKNWACWQLALHSSGKLLLFIDADVHLSPAALSSAAGLFEKYGLKMLSCFPTQRVISFGERLTVPSMHWILLAFLPLKNVLTSPSPSLIAANGQFIMFERNAYFKAGGHENVSTKVVEDMALARRLKEQTGKVMTVLGGKDVSCRMYRNFSEGLQGFSKNIFPGFNSSAPVFLSVVTVILLSALAPFYLVFKSYLFLPALILILLTRLFISFASSQNPVVNLLLHPFQMIVLALLSVYSVIINKKKRVLWKGRRI